MKGSRFKVLMKDHFLKIILKHSFNNLFYSNGFYISIWTKATIHLMVVDPWSNVTKMGFEFRDRSWSIPIVCQITDDVPRVRVYIVP